MILAANYQSPTTTAWQGRADIPNNSCFFQNIKMLDLTHSLPRNLKKSFALLGFNCDEGIRRNMGRTGAAFGPEAIRAALAKLPQNPQIQCFDAGDILCLDHHLEQAQQALATAVNILLMHQITPILLGGGHEIAWGHYLGMASHLKKSKLGIVNFDAHFDMRPLLVNDTGSSGTPFLQIANAHEYNHLPFHYHCLGIQPAGNIPLLFTTAKKFKVKYLLAEEFYLQPAKKIKNFVESIIKKNQKLYISICLDVFAASIAPGVSAPQTLGLTAWQVIPLIRQLAQSGKVFSYDIAELSPPLDKDERTAKLAASLVYEIIHHHRFKAASRS